MYKLNDPSTIPILSTWGNSGQKQIYHCFTDILKSDGGNYLWINQKLPLFKRDYSVFGIYCWSKTDKTDQIKVMSSPIIMKHSMTHYHECYNDINVNLKMDLGM